MTTTSKKTVLVQDDRRTIYDRYNAQRSFSIAAISVKVKINNSTPK